MQTVCFVLFVNSLYSTKNCCLREAFPLHCDFMISFKSLEVVIKVLFLFFVLAGSLLKGYFGQYFLHPSIQKSGKW